MDVERAPVVEAAARFARVAGFGPFGMQTVDRLDEDTGAGRLAHAARPAEEVGVGLQIFLHKDEGHWLNGQPEAEDKIIILVGVALETIKQMESQMQMRNYKGFLD